MRKSPYLDGIADYRSRSVGLDVRNVRGADAGEIQCFGNDLRLAFNTRSKIAHFARAIIVDCGSEDDGADMIPVFDRIFKAAKYDNPQAASKNSAAGSCIEGPTVAIARKNLSFAIDIALTMWDFDGNSTCQSQVALIIEQALASKMHCYQGS